MLVGSHRAGYCLWSFIVLEKGRVILVKLILSCRLNPRKSENGGIGQIQRRPARRNTRCKRASVEVPSGFYLGRGETKGADDKEMEQERGLEEDAQNVPWLPRLIDATRIMDQVLAGWKCEISSLIRALSTRNSSILEFPGSDFQPRQ